MLFLAAAAASCSSSGKPNAVDGATTTTTGSAIPPGATAVGNGVVPPSPVAGVMRETFRTKGGAFSNPDFGFAPGSRITASWYRMGDVWAVWFKGLDQALGAGKCAISALDSSSGRTYASETPYGQGTCSFFHEKVLPPGSLYRCANKAIVYKTEIPLEAKGTLVATLGRGYLPDGSVEGIRSRVTADAARAPEIAPSAGCYVVF